MLSKFTKLAILLVLVFGFISDSPISGEAASHKVMWGKTELKLGQIGKVTILQNVPLMKMDKNGGLSTVRGLKKGEEFRVYSYRQGLYGVGGGQFIHRNEVAVKYETPSKSKLALLSGKTPVVTLPTPKPVNPKPNPKPNPVVTKDKNTIYKEKLNTIKNTMYKDYKEFAENVYKIQKDIEKENFPGKYELDQEIRDLYYRGGIEADEIVISFNNGIELLVSKRNAASYNHNYPINRSVIIYNNEYYLSIPLIATVLSADLDMYYFEKPEVPGFDGNFFGVGPTYNYGAEFKDPNNKKLGSYSTVFVPNTDKGKTFIISEKDFPWAGAGGTGFMSTALNPYSVNEVKEILGVDFELTYDSKNERLTFHFDKPSKEKYPGW